MTLPARPDESPDGENLSVMRSQQFPQDLLVKVTQCLQPPGADHLEDEVMQEIKNNPGCLNQLSREKAFRQFIKRKLHRRRPSPELINSIKERIHREALR